MPVCIRLQWHLCCGELQMVTAAKKLKDAYSFMSPLHSMSSKDGPTHVARLEFPRETGLILRCAGKAG